MDRNISYWLQSCDVWCNDCLEENVTEAVDSELPWLENAGNVFTIDRIDGDAVRADIIEGCLTGKDADLRLVNLTDDDRPIPIFNWNESDGGEFCAGCNKQVSAYWATCVICDRGETMHTDGYHSASDAEHERAWMNECGDNMEMVCDRCADADDWEDEDMAHKLDVLGRYAADYRLGWKAQAIIQEDLRRFGVFEMPDLRRQCVGQLALPAC